MTGPELLEVERSLARAHIALWKAARIAESDSNQGLADDLYQLVTEVGRINESVVRRTATRKGAASRRA